MDRKTLDILKASPAAFRRRLQIEVGSELVPFRPDGWQDECFKAMDPACRKLVGLPVDSDKPCLARHLWLRPRGHSKTQDVAVIVCWLLFASPRKLSGVFAAGDLDQARLITDAITRIITANPWLSSFVTVERGRVYNPFTGSEAIVLTSDAPTSFGLLIDFCFYDEFVHGGDRNDLFESLASAIAKKPVALFCLSSNCGWTGTWQHALVESVRANPLWFVSWLDGIQASWWTEQQKTEPRALLSTQGYQRLFLNQFVSNESRAISDEDLEAACVLGGPMANRDAIDKHIFTSSLDIGIKNDRSGFVVLAVKPGEPAVKLAYAQSWKAAPGQQVQVQSIIEAIKMAKRRFKIRACHFDPSQGLFAAQVLRREGIDMREFCFTPQNCDIMASALARGFRNREVAIWRHSELLSDFRKLVLKETNAFGKLRLTAVSDSSGHADLGIAYAIGLPHAQALSQSVVTGVPLVSGWRSDPPENCATAAYQRRSQPWA